MDNFEMHSNGIACRKVDVLVRTKPVSKLINYEKQLMCRLDIDKYLKIKVVHEGKHTKKKVKFVEGINKESPPPLEIKG